MSAAPPVSPLTPIVDLAQAPRGVPLIAGPVSASPAVRRRLAELGLRTGSRVTLLRRTSGGGAILVLADSRVAVSRSVLRSIAVLPEDAEGGPRESRP